LDFGGNIKRHGPIDDAYQRAPGEGTAPMRECPECGRLNNAAVLKCECGFEFPPPVREPGKSLETAATYGGVVSNEPIRIEIDKIYVDHVVTKKGNDAIVAEFISNGERWPVHREFMNLWNKSDFAREKGWQFLNILTNGEAEKYLEANPQEIAKAVDADFKSGKLRRPDYIDILYADGDKFGKLSGWGFNDDGPQADPIIQWLEDNGGRGDFDDMCLALDYFSDHDMTEAAKKVMTLPGLSTEYYNGREILVLSR